MTSKGWSANLLFVYDTNRFSHDVAQFVLQYSSKYEMSHSLTKPTNWFVWPAKTRSAWASAQSDQRLRSALSGKLRMQCFFVRTAKTLIRQGSNVILLVLSGGGSNDDVLWVLWHRYNVLLFLPCMFLWNCRVPHLYLGVAFNPGLVGERDVVSVIIPHEQTQSNRVWTQSNRVWTDSIKPSLNRLNQNESVVFKIWTLSFRRISFQIIWAASW